MTRTAFLHSLLSIALLAVAGCGAVPGIPAPTELPVSQLAIKSNRGLGARLEGRPALSLKSPDFKLFASLPKRADLRKDCPPVYHQGPFRSCTGFAVAKGLGEFLLKKEGRHEPLSALYIYNEARFSKDMDRWNAEIPKEGNWYQDDLVAETPEASADQRKSMHLHRDLGAPIARAMEAFVQHGTVPEKFHPYPPQAWWGEYAQSPLVNGGAIVEEGTTPGLRLATWFLLPEGLAVRPQTQNLNLNALGTMYVAEAVELKSLDAMKQSVAKGMPVVCGMVVYEPFYSAEVARTGLVPMPPAKAKSVEGHAIMCVGYDDARQQLIMRNSWGADWGDKGYFYLPYAYVERGLVKDAWTVKL